MRSMLGVSLNFIILHLSGAHLNVYQEWNEACNIVMNGNYNSYAKPHEKVQYALILSIRISCMARIPIGRFFSSKLIFQDF